MSVQSERTGLLLQTRGHRGPQIRFADAPVLTAVHALLDASLSFTLYRDWAPARGSAPGARSRLVMSALGIPGLDRCPSAILPDPATTPTVSEHCTLLRDMNPQSLVDDIDTCWLGKPPRQGVSVTRRPRQWLTALAFALEDVWSTIETKWNAHKPALDTEVARLGTALVTGQLDVFVSSLHHRLTVEDGNILFEQHCSAVRALDDRELLFVPLVGTPGRLIVDFDAPEAAYIAYSLPCAENRTDAEKDDGLTYLLGPLRSAVLRAASTGHNMGDLAKQVHCARAHSHTTARNWKQQASCHECARGRLYTSGVRDEATGYFHSSIGDPQPNETDVQQAIPYSEHRSIVASDYKPFGLHI